MTVIQTGLRWRCRLQAQQKEWLASQAELLSQGSLLRGELSASQLERTRLEGELSALRETNQSLDLSNARLTSQYQVVPSHDNTPAYGLCIQGAGSSFACKEGI